MEVRTEVCIEDSTYDSNVGNDNDADKSVDRNIIDKENDRKIRNNKVAEDNKNNEMINNALTATDPSNVKSNSTAARHDNILINFNSDDSDNTNSTSDTTIISNIKSPPITPSTTSTTSTTATHDSAHTLKPTNDKSSKADDMLTSRLREVFDVCDNQSQGFITVEHFLGLAKDFASSDSHTGDKFIKRMVAALDSDGSGKISFEDFCKGVKQILLSNKSVLENGDIDQKVIQDFLIIRRQSVDASKAPEIYETPATSGFNNNNRNNNNKNNNNSFNNNNNKNTFDLFDKANSNSSEDDVDSGAWSTVTHDNFWLNSAPTNSKNANLEATPSPLSNGFPGNDFLGNGFADNEGFPGNGDLDDRMPNYFHRRVHSNNTTPRSSFRSTPGSRNGSFRRTVTPTSIANQSYRSGSTVNCSDVLLDVADSQVCELTDKILKLEDNVTSLAEIQKLNEDKQLKMKEENSIMVERCHVLEDQLRDIESMNQERLKQEQHKHREILIKTEKDKTNQIELLSRSLKLVEDEYNALKEAAPALRTENERLKKQNFNMEREMARMRQEYTELNDEKYNLQETFNAEHVKISKERETRTQLLDDLTEELNELRICKSNLLRSSPSVTRTSHANEQSEHDQEQIKHLKKENADLKVQLEEMQALLLSRGVVEGQRLLQHTSPFGNSLAFEIEQVPKNELISALQKEQEANAQLKEYIGFITLRIIDKHPSILEINQLNNEDAK